MKFKSCNNLRLSGLTHVDSVMAHIHINGCNDVTISNLRINAPESSPNTDGIDIAVSSNVIIQDCVIATGMKLSHTIFGDLCKFQNHKLSKSQQKENNLKIEMLYERKYIYMSKLTVPRLLHPIMSLAV